ncbi:MAG TPA: MASE4 domain-containing protein [Noviherbaspirillum sp.]|nr:MASE4 domain-containing protein [Noviherbaspirillum sp.]
MRPESSAPRDVEDFQDPASTEAETAGEGPQYLSTMPAASRDYGFAIGIALVSSVIFFALAPYAQLQLPQVPAFIPIYESALAINDLMTVVLLLGQFRILRVKSLLLLASAYLFTALMAVSHALTFPGLFAPGGLLGAGPQSTAWLYMFWHGGFPLIVIAYALLKGRDGDRLSSRRKAKHAIAAAFGAVIAAVAGCTQLATAGADLLPAIMIGNHYTSAMLATVTGVWMSSLFALLVLWRRRPHSVLDLWLMVVMCAWLFDIALSAVLNAGRFDLGFYAGRIYGLLAATFVLAVMLIENERLHVRLAEMHGMERKKTNDLQILSAQLKQHAEERRLAIEALHSKEEQIRAIVDNMNDCVLTIDAHGIVRSANPALQRVLGYTAEEIIGHNVSMIIPEPYRSLHDAHLDNYLRTGEAHIIGIGREVDGVHKEGHRIPLELSVSEYAIHGQRLFIGTLRDIRERKQFIADLTTARSEAEQANRAKSAFLATMSHEIRTPMNGVIGIAEVLARSRLTEQQADLAKTIHESATTLLSLIDDILDFSKIEAGRLDIEYAPLCIADLAEGICNSLLPVASRGGVDLLLFIAPDIPPAVQSDDVRLRQILYNLVGNAIKFSAKRPERRGRVALRITVVQHSPLQLAFAVVDNGIGMTAETLDHIFAPFTQAEISTTRRFGGTGLGLAICKRLVDLMQGEIAVASVPGEGSSFSVVLPFEIADGSDARPMPDLSGLDCIVVEQEGFAADDVRTYLEYAGARVRVAADPAGAAREAAAMPGTVVVIQDAGSSKPVVHPAFASAERVRHLFITHGRSRRGKGEAADIVTVEGDVLRRRALIRAVAVAAGRASPEMQYERPGDAFAEEPVPPPDVAEARAQGRLILIAEDDEINRKLILHQLGLLGYAGVIAANGQAALALWRTGDYALLLTDLHMPEMDGYTLVETIRREEAGRQRLPILALTANALRGEVNRAMAAGMDEFLTKPVELARLQAALEKWLPPPAEPVQVPSGETRNESAAVFDANVLKTLVGDDEGIVQGFLADYLACARRLGTALRAAGTAGDLAQVASIAHKLKASSRSIGALALGDLCDELERQGNTEGNAAIAGQLLRFDTILSEVEASIDGYLRGKEK